MPHVPELFELEFGAPGPNQVHVPFIVNQLEPFDIFDDTLKRNCAFKDEPTCAWAGGLDHPSSPTTVVAFDTAPSHFATVPDLDALMSDLRQSQHGSCKVAVPLPSSANQNDDDSDPPSSTSEDASQSGDAIVQPVKLGSGKPRVRREKRTKEQRQQRRREKQRIIARNFRKRKKEHLIGLQDDVKRLRLENDRLRKEMGRREVSVGVGPAPEQETDPPAGFDWESLESMVASRNEAAVKVFLQKHGSMGQEDLEPEKDRSTQFHIDQLAKNLHPSQLIKMAVLGLCQKADGGAQKEMWNIMSTSLSLTPKQQDAILKNVGNIHTHHRDLVRAQDSLVEMRCKATDAVKAMASITKSVVDQLSPLQQAQHLVWKEKNKACLQMIYCMWTMQSSAARASQP